jgi:hypothetical protein
MPKGEEREDIDVLEEGADQRRDLHGTGGCARTPRSAPPSSNSGFASFVSVSTQTDIVGASAYMQYMSDMPQGGTIEDLPDIASFMCDAQTGVFTGSSGAHLNSMLDGSVSDITGDVTMRMGTASKKILRCAEKLDMRLIPHLEALEAKANAIVSISAVDIEAEERRQRQERAQVQLVQDSHKLFHLKYQVEAATLLLNQQLAKRSDQNLSNIQADIQEDDADTRDAKCAKALEP